MAEGLGLEEYAAQLWERPEALQGALFSFQEVLG
jgi:hypothetical protein